MQTGAWILPDERPLPAELVAFLDAGTPPVYVSFGSVRAPEDAARVAIEAMRDPAVKDKLASQGAELIGDTPEHFRGFIDDEIKKWEKVIKDAGVETAK